VSVCTVTRLIIAYLYGAHPGEGSLTQYISDAFHEDVRKWVSKCSRLTTVSSSTEK